MPDQVPDSNDEAGVTLLEMLVVLAILATAVALAASQMRGVAGRVEVRSVAQDLASRLRATRATSIGRSITRGITFESAPPRYSIDADARMVNLPPGLSLSVVSARQMTVEPGQARIVFFADGSSSGGTVLLARGGQRVAVGVEWLTGAVSVEPMP